MVLFAESLSKYTPLLRDNNVRVRFLGRREGVPGELRETMGQLEQVTGDNSGLVLNLAINYGGRDEILRAFNTIVSLPESRPDALTEDGFRHYLDTGPQPDPDLVIRTAGEKRMSNFLLWQAAYAELWFTDVLWPEFTPEVLHRVFQEFVERKRRFGGLV